MSRIHDPAERKRRRREYIIIALTLIAVVGLTVLEVRLSKLSEQLPIHNNILFFALLNVDLILVLLLVFLVVRNLTKLFVERRKGIFGSRLKTRLVAAFVGLTLIPTGVLFFLALQFMNFSFEGWFDPQVTSVFETSNEIVQGKYEDDGEELLHFGKQVRNYLQEMNLLNPDYITTLKEYLEYKRKEYALGDIRVVWKEGDRAVVSSQSGLSIPKAALAPSGEFIQKAFNGQEGYSISPSEGADIVRSVVPIHESGPAGPIKAALVTQVIIDKSLFRQLEANKKSYQSYQNLRQLKNPLKTIHVIFLVLTSLLVLFGASWFGFHIAKTLTVPLVRLASATERVAQGELDARLEEEGRDEMATLARSFNRMTSQLETGTRELERAYNALEAKNTELEQRRLYMEIVLANVGAGVVSTDSNMRITTINKSAENIFKINVPEVLGKTHREVLKPEHARMLEDLMAELPNRKDGSVRRAIMLNINGTPLHFQVTITELRTDDGNLIGLVGIFEDMTEILQAQKAIAWREVARRIAHEIKNPLTPIQLNAERLRKRCAGKIDGEDEKVFRESINLIIEQVRELRQLVDEFRKFARMPSAKPAPADINEVVREVAALYQEGSSEVTFSLSLDHSMPVFDVDREQIKRMLNNLFDNAVAAIDGEGEITVTTSFIEQLQIARLEVSDTGKGIPEQDRDKIFEPDFSTKKSGSGLGLAIVQRIVSDHFGFIRVHSNEPQGTVFVIELPTQLPRMGMAAVSHRYESRTDESSQDRPEWSES